MTEHILLPGTGAELVRRELQIAFTQFGCHVTTVSPDVTADFDARPGLEEMAASAPSLVFSVNFQGLQNLKGTMEVMLRHKGDVAAWLVDNPWNILAGVRDPRWKEVLLFVTDASFIAPLKAHGARRVFHLPLAASPELFGASLQGKSFQHSHSLADFVFVGRSAFPGKETFFRGQAVPQTILDKAMALLAQGKRPDLSWWESILKCDPGAFWPGKKARLPALGAEESNFAWRSLCLKTVASEAADKGTSLDIFGDDGWLSQLPDNSRLHPPVDYYTRLPHIYAEARYTLCLTSLQLPCGLNQRHFDAWIAGGLCLTDATPGLDLFPDELTYPVTFKSASDIMSTAARLEQAQYRSQLIGDWQKYLLQNHTYLHRVGTILEALDSTKS